MQVSQHRILSLSIGEERLLPAGGEFLDTSDTFTDVE
jgi:hypothetical protein